MLPFITAMSSLLLLTCFIGVASATGEDNTNQILQPVVLPEATMAEAGVTAREPINLTLFNWMYNETEKATHLTICAEESLIVPGDVMKTDPTLVYWIDIQNQTNIEGNVLDQNTSCSLFTQDGNAPLAKKDTVYQISLIVTNNENITTLRSGSETFGMPVETSTLNCHDKPYTRVSGLTSDQIIHINSTCISDGQPLGDDVVCYLEGEFSSSNLCFTIKTDLQVCLQGSSPAPVDEVDGLLAISYLAYKDVEESTAAHLALKFEGHEQTGRMEALIWKAGKSSATKCPDSSCPITDFTPGFTQYDVCAVTFVAGVPSNTSTSSITDLNVDAFTYKGSLLLQFDYTNANEKRYYSAYVGNNEDNPVTVDCTAVPLNRNCHGYFEGQCTDDDLIVAVEYADSATGATGNKILSKYKAAASRRR